MLVVVLELAGYLGPVVVLLLVNLLAVGVLYVVLKPAAVPVYVDDGIHVLGHDPAYDFVHAGEPVGVDGVFILVGHMAVPSAGYAHGVKAESLQALDVVLVDLGVAPSGLA